MAQSTRSLNQTATALERRALAVGALSIALLVARDGQPLWLLLRLALVAAVWWCGRQARTPYVRMVLGVVLLTVGGVIGVAYLTHAGVALVPLVALAGAAAGGVLLALSLRHLVAARRGVRRLIPGVALLALGQLVVLPMITAVHATNVPPSALGNRSPSSYGFPYDDITLRTTDGVELAAWYIPSQNGAAVVVLHGAGSTRSSVLEHAAVLAGEGFGALILDARGHGESGGDAMDLGWHAERDVRAAVDWLAGRAEVEPGRIGAVGLSMGGEEALTAAATDPRIQAVVAEGVTGRVADDGRWADGSITDPLRRAVDLTTDLLIDLLTNASPPQPLRNAIAAMRPRQALLITGRPRAELAAAERYQGAAPDVVTIWHLPDTPHTDGLAEHPAAWTSRVVSFLREELR
jgi:fermentation-respiration switch protein FrsA (DUF1100 family)